MTGRQARPRAAADVAQRRRGVSVKGAWHKAGLAPPSKQTIKLGGEETLADRALWEHQSLWNGAPILTAQGLVPIERLSPGVEVLTASGLSRRIAFLQRHEASAEGEEPGPAISFSAGALGAGHPDRGFDLLPSTPVRIDEQILPARTLVNGATIRYRLRDDADRHWHLALADDDRGDAAGTTPYAPLLRHDGIVHADEPLAQTLSNARAPTAIRQRLLDVALASGHVLTLDADLRILVEGTVIAPLRIKTSRYLFAIPPRAKALRLMSRTWVPAEVVPESDDERVLGVCVRRIVLDGHELSLADFGAGWHLIEDHGTLRVRWTGGLAVVPLTGARYLDVELYGSGHYWGEASSGQHAL